MQGIVHFLSLFGYSLLLLLLLLLFVFFPAL
jgi:hypothetical protein